MLREGGYTVRNPLGTISIDPSVFVMDQELPKTEDLYLPILSTTELIYNAHPTKLGTGCIRSVAMDLAKRELKEHVISERMSSANYMLHAICRSISGGYEIDGTWAAIILVVYLSCDPRGRVLLREQSNLTDLDLQTAYVLEAYGRSEITRRVRLNEQQAQQANGPPKKRVKKGKGKEPEPEPEEDDESVPDVLSPHSSTNDDQQRLATKKRRAGRGLASAGCSDAHGLMDWYVSCSTLTQHPLLNTLS
jgi:hypothetical protein